jgi:hypothetical protein
MMLDDRQAMTLLPPVAPQVGLTHRIRLARDYYVRVDANDYSVDPQVIGRFDGQLVARHDRSWARHMVITDPAHVPTAHQMRLALAEQRRTQQRAQQRAEQSGGRRHSDGHPVAIRAEPRGVNFQDPLTPSGRYDETGSAACCTSTCRSHDPTRFSAPTGRSNHRAGSESFMWAATLSRLRSAAARS